MTSRKNLWVGLLTILGMSMAVACFAEFPFHLRDGVEEDLSDGNQLLQRSGFSWSGEKSNANLKVPLDDSLLTQESAALDVDMTDETSDRPATASPKTQPTPTVIEHLTPIDKVAIGPHLSQSTKPQ